MLLLISKDPHDVANTELDFKHFGQVSVKLVRNWYQRLQILYPFWWSLKTSQPWGFHLRSRGAAWGPGFRLGDATIQSWSYAGSSARTLDLWNVDRSSMFDQWFCFFLKSVFQQSMNNCWKGNEWTPWWESHCAKREWKTIRHGALARQCHWNHWSYWS